MESTVAHPHAKTLTTSLNITSVSFEEYQSIANGLPTLTLNHRHLCDIELILNGGFAPLNGFMHKVDYDHVLDTMRLNDGTLWPMPITLDVDGEFAKKLQPGNEIALRDVEGLLISIMQISDCWEVNRQREAQAVFNTTDESHPGVAYLYHHVKDYYLGGTLLKVSLPYHYDFNYLRNTPTELRELFRQRGWNKIVAFQTRNPMHRAHQELTIRAAQQTGANVLIHPVVGMTKPGDIEYYLRVRCYEHVLKIYTPQSAFLSLLPLAMRMGGPREALWHAIIRKNYGCTHFIVGRDHAGPGKNRSGQDFYSPYAAQTLALQYQQEIGIEIVPFQEMVYSNQQSRYFPIDQFPKDEAPITISGTELRDRLQKNADIPAWFSYPEVIAELRKAYPLKHKQGFTILLTGLPSSGKSTLANALLLKIRELTGRPITLLDGDEIRTHLSYGLGFSRKDRECNIARVGYVAKEITKHRGIAICALVAPYQEARNQIRQMISDVGGFIEVYVSTPLSVCETRDRKGLYKKAREGLIKQFTGVSDHYESPVSPELEIDTTSITPSEVMEILIKKITLLGYIR